MNIAAIRKQFPQYNDLPDEQLVIGLHKAYYSDMPFQEFHRNIQYNAPDPTQGMGGLEKFNAGMGKAFTDLGRGARQLVGMGPNAQDVQQQRKEDAPLMKTGAGVAGNVAGNIAAFAPLALVPGANTVAGAGALGSIAASLQPTESPEERLMNQGAGLALGAGTQAVAGPLAKRVGEWGAGRQADAASRQSQNSVRDATLKAGHEAGYVVPPSAVNQPSFIGGRMESLGGKAALGQESSLRNQPVTDALSRRAGGLGEHEPISTQTLKTARQRMSQPYRDTAALSPQAAADLEALKAAKLESKLQWAHYNRQGDPNAYKAATAADAQANALLNNIEQAAQSAGRPELVQALQKARIDIARNHEVRNALNAGSGNVDASVIGRSYDRNPDRFSGELKTIGAFQQAFPSYTREASKVPPPGVGKTELLASALLGGGGALGSDSPYGALAGLAPFASGPARSLLLSKAVQGAVANQKYSAGALANTAATLANPETRQKAALLARGLALPAIPQAVNQ